MYELKGFMQIQPLVSNANAAISAIGELSTQARTYSKDTGYHSNVLYPDVDFISFFSVVDQNDGVDVPSSYSDKILEIGQWMYEQAVVGMFTSSSASCLASILNHFNGDISNVVIGPMVIHSDGVSYLPEYIEFVIEPVLTDPNKVKVWFSDVAFREQYDEYTVVVVPPVDSLDSLLQGPITVKAILDSVSDTIKMERIQAAINNKPPSFMRTVEYDWSNPSSPDIELPTPWSILIYGIAGNNVDVIRAAIVEYVLAYSSQPREVWQTYIPDAFITTEFVITPLWDNYSIPNETLVTGLQSPTIRHNEVLAKALDTSPNYPEAHVTNYLSCSVANYKSTAFLIVGGPENRDQTYLLKDKFPDYFVIPTTSNEYSRMSVYTQEWAALLANMLLLADTMTEYSTIPINMSRLVRNGIMYLVSTYDNIQYLVVSRKSYEELFVTPGG